MLGLLVITASVTGCTLKAPKVPTVSTGEVQVITWTIESTWTRGSTWTDITIPSSAMEEFTGEFDSWVVPTVTGSEWVNVNTGVTAEVKSLIQERESQPKDTTKLNENDITLMEKVIDLFRSKK